MPGVFYSNLIGGGLDGGNEAGCGFVILLAFSLGQALG